MKDIVIMSFINYLYKATASFLRFSKRYEHECKFLWKNKRHKIT
jgi:hypothetical protein